MPTGACYSPVVRTSLILGAIVVGGGCGAGAKRAPAVPTDLSNAGNGRGCAEAAAGLEGATVGIRPPEESVLVAMRQRCLEDQWSGASIDCFATMKIDDLGRCAALLAERPRDQMFAVIGGDRRGPRLDRGRGGQALDAQGRRRGVRSVRLGGVRRDDLRAACRSRPGFRSVTRPRTSGRSPRPAWPRTWRSAWPTRAVSHSRPFSSRRSPSVACPDQIGPTSALPTQRYVHG